MERVYRAVNGTSLGLLLAVVPLFLWLIHDPAAVIITRPAQAYGFLGKAAALTGTVLMAWSFVLAARFKWLESTYRGLDKMYAAHAGFGALAFILVGLHAVFLTLRSGTRGLDSAISLWLNTNIGVLLGVASLVGFLLLMAVTLSKRIKYHHFVWLHRLLGPVFLLGAAHAYMVGRQLSTNPAMKWYMGAVIAAGLGSYLYYSVLGKWLLKRYRYTVTGIRELTGDTIEISMRRDGRPFTFAPGQFAYVRLEDPRFGEAHPFSMSSGKYEKEIRFIIKDLGDYTDIMDQIKPGTKAWLEGPYGGFTNLNKAKRQVWVAGGIGITPFLSMARSLGKRKYEVDLYYCTKQTDNGPIAAELKAIAKQHPRLKVIPWPEDQKGFISADIIIKNSPDIAAADFFVCGPPALLSGVKGQLGELGVSGSRVFFEDFSYK